MAKKDDTCYKFPNCKGCTDKNCSIYNCIHTDNKETLQNALKRIEELKKEYAEQINKMKNCANCKHSEEDNKSSTICDECFELYCWEIKE